jgi:hypothetical protein
MTISELWGHTAQRTGNVKIAALISRLELASYKLDLVADKYGDLSGVCDSEIGVAVITEEVARELNHLYCNLDDWTESAARADGERPVSTHTGTRVIALLDLLIQRANAEDYPPEALRRAVRRVASHVQELLTDAEGQDLYDSRANSGTCPGTHSVRAVALKPPLESHS